MKRSLFLMLFAVIFGFIFVQHQTAEGGCLNRSVIFTEPVL